ncbi:amine oxidase [Polyporus arcularius HHB13444]|uniref:Amine oxidase n=1 Tax=Polyporus arcularius HHB13444 TaxID=1314778 RepID=A0A5C3P1V6_9APHY|nr:amine oxidase [Polyporus arcularius HHB13444]
MAPSLTSALLWLATYGLLSALAFPIVPDGQSVLSFGHGRKDTKVLILGGGVAGIIAARTLHEQGIDDFIILEARSELGGRMMSRSFGVEGNQWQVEVGANWVQGTQTEDGPANPIWELAKKHNVSLHSSHYFGSVTTYDDSGQSDFQDVFQQSVDNFHKLTAIAGARVPKRLVDMTARSGYALSGSRPRSRYEMAAEYYQFDWEFGATPEETSWLASSWAHNNTFLEFSRENLLSVDQRGFKTLIQTEAAEFLTKKHVRLNATVGTVQTSKKGVVVTLTDGAEITADYALCTFSLGVLQHDDVRFVPPLPAWKQEAIHSMSMGTYTKIFLQFPQKFWFDTEMALYADHERGRYPVWQTLDHPAFFPGCGILFVTVTGDFSRRIESMSDTAVKEEILSVLENMFPNATIPDPLDFYFQRWFTDPLFRGSYSNWPANFLSEHQGNLRANVDERLWFAGEATSKKWFGYLHGAYTEGEDIGLTLAECIKGGGCLGLEHVERVRNALPYDVE